MVADGLLAALVTVLGLPGLFTADEALARLDIRFRSPDALAVLLTLAQTVPLVWRRRAPGVVLAVTGLATLAHLAFGYPPTWAEFGPLIALYTVAAHRPRRRSAIAAALVAVGLAVYAAIAMRRYPGPAEARVQGWAVSYAQFAAAWFLGTVQERRLAYTAKLEALNAQLADEQELRSRWAVAAERSRIARELHDVVAHSVSVMVVQAGAARRTLTASPGQAATALGQVESTGRQALVELRRLLGRCATATGPATTPSPPAEPGQPGVAGHGGPRGRPAGRGGGRGPAAGAPGRGRPVRLPDRAGGVDQLAQARRPGPGQRPGLLRPRGPGDPGRGRRGRHGERPGVGPRPHRHAGAGGPVRRHPGDRRPPRRRLPGRRPVAPGRRVARVTIRVLIADDQPLMRTGFRMILDAEPDLEVVGEAADGGDAVRLAGHVRADVVLMDIRMPGMDGIEATRRLAGDGVQDPVRVLILTTFDLDEYVLSALRAGASGFLLKDVPPEDLVDAIKVVAAGDALLAPSVTRRLLDRFASNLPDPAAARPAALDSLTARELEVLGLVARGMSNAEIAEHLVVSETTVKTHVGRLLAKLDLRDRVQAVVLAYETGIVRPGAV
jgi:DNA-binding NarL/FixJ family response regulator